MAKSSDKEEAFLELSEEELSNEALDTQVQRAQEQLLTLKRQQDQIEKQKRELEELSRRQDQLHQGKAEAIEKLTRAMVVLERETFDAEKRVEQLRQIQASFTQHLDILDAINPKTWDKLDVNKELTKALGAVDDANSEYSKSRSKITPEVTEEMIEAGIEPDPFALDDGGGEKSFFYWMKAGLAFTLPLVILGILTLIILLAIFTQPA